MDVSYHPTNWFRAILGNKVDHACKNGTDLWTKWKNLKGLLSNIAQQDRSHGVFKYLTFYKIVNFIGLLTLNGLCLSIRFKHKFKTQQEDPVFSNNMCTRAFGANSERRWK